MISKVKAAVSGLVGSLSNKHGALPGPCTPEKEPPVVAIAKPQPPCRPPFLKLTPEESHKFGDHNSRIVLSLKSPDELYWGTGYAEVINAGKSQHNEDQACCEFVTVEERDGRLNSKCNESQNSDVQSDTQISDGLSFYYWGLFDGHAGYGCSLTASRLLHLHICDQLRDLVYILQKPTIAAPLCLENDTRNGIVSNTQTQEKTEPPLDTVLRFHLEKQVFPESLVIGALENAFRQMDEQIERERTSHSIDGGCCALVAICLLDKLFVANAGDSRAIIIQQGKTISMSQEFTPETERQRLQFLAVLQPDLLGNEFTCLEFPRRIQQKEIRKRMLYRDHTMTGWAYKTIEEDDMKFPLVYGEGKKARVMATIGVTRGFGDHDLKVYNSNIYIKPFLSSVPAVEVYDLSKCEHSADDVIVMGTDGLWDVISDIEVAEVVQRVFASHGPNEPNRYNLAAQELVLRTRGVRKESGWRLPNGKLASLDDISVFVIPLSKESS
ncbi:PREDICTED: protein phosphatase 1H-like [Nanorana parkeri]|uniref:protein phosphatase 1H-like n=1 Tax=Nanorana parkeri TaxID=125878 RepID=UPI00085462A9|nr:PREDICTED: protein phosphatase 1H-like [Nanorana parkeri]